MVIHRFRGKIIGSGVALRERIAYYSGRLLIVQRLNNSGEWFSSGMRG